MKTPQEIQELVQSELDKTETDCVCNVLDNGMTVVVQGQQMTKDLWREIANDVIMFLEKQDILETFEIQAINLRGFRLFA